MNVFYSLQVSSRLEMFADELERSELTDEIQKAEQMLRMHQESVTHMHNSIFQVIQQGTELAQVSEPTSL